MFENCEEVISQVKRPVEPKKILWILDGTDDPETMEILKDESKLLFEVGNGDGSSVLEFSLGNTNDTVDETECHIERTFLSLHGKLIKRGLGCSSSFHIEVHSSHEDAALKRILPKRVFHFGDKSNTSVVIMPDLYQLSSDIKRKYESYSNTRTTYSPSLGKRYSALPARYKIGIIVTPLYCTVNSTKPASSTKLPSSSKLNIPVNTQSQNGESLSQQLGQFYSDVAENYSDIKLESKDGMVLKAHRFVLAARSKKVHELIEESMKSNTFNGTIKICDMDGKALYVLIHWIYTGKLDGVTENILEDLIKAAVKFELTELFKTLDEEIIKICNSENMFRLFQIAKQNEMEAAKRDIAAFIKKNIG